MNLCRRWQSSNSFCDNHNVWENSCQLCRVMGVGAGRRWAGSAETSLRQLTSQFLMRASQTPDMHGMTLQIYGCLPAGAARVFSQPKLLPHQFLFLTAVAYPISTLSIPCLTWDRIKCNMLPLQTCDIIKITRDHQGHWRLTLCFCCKLCSWCVLKYVLPFKRKVH